jgi:tetratricopeptide (TPR) repeat protein
MNEELYIEQLLDDCFQQKLSRPDAIALLEQKGVPYPENEIDLHHAAAISIQRYHIRRQVQNVHKHYLEQQSILKANEPDLKAKVIPVNGVKWFLRIAASILLLAGFWFAWLFTHNNSTKLYAEIYQPYNLNTNRANIDEIVPHNMIREFKEKNYTAVIETYRNIAVSNNREKFLAAVSYQESGNPQQAIQLLNEILMINKQEQSRLYNDEAEFYLALNYLRLNDMKQAIPLFQKIYDDPGHTYHERIGASTLKKIKWLD